MSRCKTTRIVDDDENRCILDVGHSGQHCDGYAHWGVVDVSHAAAERRRSLRDQYAGQAMAAMIAAGEPQREETARDAVWMAEALVAALYPEDAMSHCMKCGSGNVFVDTAPHPGHYARTIQVIVERILAGEAPAEVVADYGWEFDPPDLSSLGEVVRALAAARGRLITAAHATGKAWLAGGVDLDEAITRKCARLEELVIQASEARDQAVQELAEARAESSRLRAAVEEIHASLVGMHMDLGSTAPLSWRATVKWCLDRASAAISPAPSEDCDHCGGNHPKYPQGDCDDSALAPDPRREFSPDVGAAQIAELGRGLAAFARAAAPEQPIPVDLDLTGMANASISPLPSDEMVVSDQRLLRFLVKRGEAIEVRLSGRRCVRIVVHPAAGAAAPSPFAPASKVLPPKPWPERPVCHYERCVSTATHGPAGERPVACWQHAGEWPPVDPRASRREP